MNTTLSRHDTRVVHTPPPLARLTFAQRTSVRLAIWLLERTQVTSYQQHTADRRNTIDREQRENRALTRYLLTPHA